MSEIFLCGGAADATVLSNVFIDEYLKDANDAQKNLTHPIIPGSL